ncbi:MAG TPA: hypothetical protein VFZ98_09425, partial [Vicinamibacterales bacterium]
MGLGVWALCGLLLGISTAAQQPTFRSGVDLVQADVVVVDGDGYPVRGLKQSDFTILDRKKQQTI